MRYNSEQKRFSSLAVIRRNDPVPVDQGEMMALRSQFWRVATWRFGMAGSNVPSIETSRTAGAESWCFVLPAQCEHRLH